MKSLPPSLAARLSQLRTSLAAVFAIRKGERSVALVGMAVFVFFNALLIAAHFDRYTIGAHAGFWSIFYNHLNVSGYDIFSCILLSCMRVHFAVLRHPLYLVVLLPFYWLNQALMNLTGFNFAIFFTSFINVFCATYAAVFLFRTLHSLTALRRPDAMLLTAFFFSFAHVLLPTMVPDHFSLSLFLLTFTLWYVGGKMAAGRPLGWRQTGVLLFLTAGVTLTNGVKTAIALLFANGRRAFAWRFVAVFAVATALLLGLYFVQERTVIAAQNRNISHIENSLKKKDPHFADKSKVHDAWVKRQNGRALDDDMPLLEWSDMTTPRLRSLTENVFGESIQLHRDHLLEDVQTTRPVFVAYRWVANYVVEALVIVLFVLGVWQGRRLRLLWMALSWAAFDMVMHLGFGFGLNEVYIMTSHWAAVIPLAVAFLFRGASRGRLMAARAAVALLSLWLWIYNGSLIITYLI